MINSEDKVKNELLLLKEKYLTTIKVNQELKKLTESTDVYTFINIYSSYKLDHILIILIIIINFLFRIQIWKIQ